MKYLLTGLILFLLPVLSLTAFDDIFDAEPEGSTQNNVDGTLPGIELTGLIESEVQFFFDERSESEVVASALAELNLLVSTESVEGIVNLEIDTEILTDQDGADFSMSYRDVVDELYIKGFLPFGFLEAGFLKVEWGKGDGVHVLDPLNFLDQSDGLELNTMELKQAEWMGKMNFYTGPQGLLELVYKPHYHSTKVLDDGRWSAFDLAPIPGTIQPLPDTETLAFSQGAARYTNSFGGFDLGAMYYYGFMPEPGFKIDMPDPDPDNWLTEIIYTQAQLFGVEGAVAAGPLTLRWEAGYWLSEDRKGTIPELYNDRLVYLAGVDTIVPGTELFLSLQAYGDYTLHTEGLSSMDVDVMTGFGTPAHTNNLVAAVELPFYHQKMKIRLSGLYVIETESYLINPEFFWSISDSLELYLKGQIIGGSNIALNPYNTWANNDNLKAGLTFRY